MSDDSRLAVIVSIDDRTYVFRADGAPEFLGTNRQDRWDRRIVAAMLRQALDEVERNLLEGS